MNAPVKIDTSLERTARDILADLDIPAHFAGASLQRAAKIAAQAYLDNLSDGYDEPEELLDILADIDEEEREQSAQWAAERRAGHGDWDARPAESYVPAGGVA